ERHPALNSRSLHITHFPLLSLPSFPSPRSAFTTSRTLNLPFHHLRKAMAASAQSSSSLLPLPPAREIPATFSASLRSWYVNGNSYYRVFLYNSDFSGGQQVKREVRLPKNVSFAVCLSFD